MIALFIIVVDCRYLMISLFIIVVDCRLLESLFNCQMRFLAVFQVGLSGNQALVALNRFQMK